MTKDQTQESNQKDSSSAFKELIVMFIISLLVPSVVLPGVFTTIHIIIAAILTPIIYVYYQLGKMLIND